MPESKIRIGSITFGTMLEFDKAVQKATWDGFDRYKEWSNKRAKQYKKDLQRFIIRSMTTDEP